MDIRSFGQGFMNRIKQLPQGVSGAASNLPARAQAALQDLPKNVEEGAKALLANEQVAEGWRTVAKGVGEMRGKVPTDQVELTKPEAKPSSKPVSEVAKKAKKASKKTTHKAHTSKTSARVKQGVEEIKKTRPTPSVPKNLHSAETYQAAAKSVREEAAILRQTGHAAEAKELSALAKRLDRARSLYKAGNKPAATRMVHAKIKMGLASPRYQELHLKAKQAEELLATFGKNADGKVFKRAKIVPQAAESLKPAATIAKEAVQVGEKTAKAGRTAGSAGRVARGAQKTKTALKAAGEGAELAKAAKAGKTLKAAGAASGVANGTASGIMGGVKNFFGKIGDSIKGLFGKASGAMNSSGWQTVKQGFGQMLPGIGKAIQSSAIFSAVISLGENLFLMMKGERSVGRAIGGVVGDTVAGIFGGIGSALASGAAIAGLGALGVVGMPLTIAAAAIGILSFTVFDRFFRNTGLYDSLTHLFT